MTSLAFPISSLVDPVFLFLVAMALGLALSGGGAGARPLSAKVGRALALGAWLSLWLLATPWVSTSLARWLSMTPRDLDADLAGTPPERRALVVLSAGIDPDEFGEPAMERLSEDAVERCFGAARIYREHGFGHVIVSGRLSTAAPAELGTGMADLLATLGVPRDRIVLETESLDTRENALYSTRLVRTLPVDTVVLVTSALHMPRALTMFERAGLPVVPAPVNFQPPPPEGLQRVIPSAHALRRSQRVMHEIVGLLEP